MTQGFDPNNPNNQAPNPFAQPQQGQPQQPMMQPQPGMQPNMQPGQYQQMPGQPAMQPGMQPGQFPQQGMAQGMPAQAPQPEPSAAPVADGALGFDAPSRPKAEKYNTQFITSNMTHARRRTQMLIAGLVVAIVGGIGIMMALMGGGEGPKAVPEEAAAVAAEAPKTEAAKAYAAKTDAAKKDGKEAKDAQAAASKK